jgi:glutamyl/glutaminyl-tRNA synthetase
VFDKTKLSWMNGQFLRALPDEEVTTWLLALLLELQVVRAALLLCHHQSPKLQASYCLN